MKCGGRERKETKPKKLVKEALQRAVVAETKAQNIRLRLCLENGEARPSECLIIQFSPAITTFVLPVKVTKATSSGIYFFFTLLTHDQGQQNSIKNIINITVLTKLIEESFEEVSSIFVHYWARPRAKKNNNPAITPNTDIVSFFLSKRQVGIVLLLHLYSIITSLDIAFRKLIYGIDVDAAVDIGIDTGNDATHQTAQYNSAIKLNAEQKDKVFAERKFSMSECRDTSTEDTLSFLFPQNTSLTEIN